MLKKILTYLKYTGLILAIGLFVFGIIWADIQLSGSKCKAVTIDIVNTDSVSFVTEGSIINMLNNSGLHPEGKYVSLISTDKIEEMLNSSEYIENAECVLMPNNVIHLTVTQLIPILRVFDGEETYYLNKDGKHMNASSRFHAEVPIVSGKFNKHADALMVRPIAEYVMNDKDLNDLVTMYSVRDSGNIFIVPCIYGHVINFGDNKNIENKFNKLKKFYREVMPVKGWLTYDTITLKWNYQVVANRRTKKIKQEIIYNPEEEEVAPPVESIIIQGINDPATLDKEGKDIPISTKIDTTVIKKMSGEKPKDSVPQTQETKHQVQNAKTKVANAFGKNNN